MHHAQKPTLLLCLLPEESKKRLSWGGGASTASSRKRAHLHTQRAGVGAEKQEKLLVRDAHAVVHPRTLPENTTERASEQNKRTRLGQETTKHDLPLHIVQRFADCALVFARKRGFKMAKKHRRALVCTLKKNGTDGGKI